MRNVGWLLLLAGIFVVVNSGSFRDVVMGKASFGFLNPKSVATPNTGAKPGTSTQNA